MPSSYVERQMLWCAFACADVCVTVEMLRCYSADLALGALPATIRECMQVFRGGNGLFIGIFLPCLSSYLFAPFEQHAFQEALLVQHKCVLLGHARRKLPMGWVGMRTDRRSGHHFLSALTTCCHRMALVACHLALVACWHEDLSLNTSLKVVRCLHDC